MDVARRTCDSLAETKNYNTLSFFANEDVGGRRHNYLQVNRKKMLTLLVMLSKARRGSCSGFRLPLERGMPLLSALYAVKLYSCNLPAQLSGF